MADRAWLHFLVEVSFTVSFMIYFITAYRVVISEHFHITP